jgi:hypothetical protein
MIEFFKHTFGLCGETHPSLLSIAGISSLLYMCRIYISMYCIVTIDFIKTWLTGVYKSFHHN